jgi:general secretion pathway protein K
MTRTRDQGVSLLNVLFVVAIGAGLVQVMLTAQDHALEEAQNAQDAAQALSFSQAGIASVAVALKRDMTSGPEADHLNEAWASAAQQTLTLEFGTFDVSVIDLRGRFDVNALGPGAIAERRVFVELLRVLEMPEVLADRIANGVPVRTVAALKPGLAPVDFQRLQPHIVALPGRSAINLNTATEPLLAAFFGNSDVARILVQRRAAKGYLERSDLTALGLVRPARVGFTSDVFEVRSEVSVGSARRDLVRRLFRDPETGTVLIQPAH